MESKYKSIKHIGEGAFSSVILALNIENGEKVAIKKMKKRRWKDTAAQAEISALQRLHHDNIIRLLDVFREDYRSFLVFECMDCDLNELVVSRNGRRLPDTVILDITYQVLSGLDFIHRNSLFHRDIKPENVLIRRHITSGGPGGSSSIIVEAKIADFGLVHDLDFSRPLTDYISTRWYRAPEVLLNCANYSTPIDVWAVGTIIAELATLRPLFPGANQIDQLRRIFEVLGTPRISAPAPGAADAGAEDAGSWYEGAVHARKLGIAFVPSQRKPLGTVLPDVSGALSQLIDYLLVLNPVARPTAHDGLVLVSQMLDQHLGESPAHSEDARVPADAEPDFQAVPHPVHLPESRGGSSGGGSPRAVAPDAPSVHSAQTGGSQPQKQQQSSPSFGPTSADSELASPAANELKLASAANAATTANAATAAKAATAAVQDGRISFTPRDQFVLGPAKQQPSSVAEATVPVQPLSSGSSSYVSILPTPAAARPSVEVSIVQGLHKEPIRDPRGDLSDLAVRPAAPALAMPAVMAGASRAMARRIVLPHMRATTPVSASVPAPQIVPRGTGSNDMSDDEYVSIDSAARQESGHQQRQRTRPARLGIGRDPRLSSLRGRSHSVSTEGSVGSGRPAVVSPTSSRMTSRSRMTSQSRGSEAFSLSDIPSPADASDSGLRIYDAQPAAIGKASLMTVLAQNDGGAAGATIGHIRKAAGIAAAAPASRNAEKRKSDLTRMGQEHVLGIDGFVPLRSPVVSSPAGSFLAGSSLAETLPAGSLPAGSVPAGSLPAGSSPAAMAQSHLALARPSPTAAAASLEPAPPHSDSQQRAAGRQGRLLGLRSKGGLGSPLIRRALSMKKKGSRESQRSGEAAAEDAPPVPASQAPQLPAIGSAPSVKRSRSALALNGQAAGGPQLSVGDISGQFDLSAEAQAALDERIRGGVAAAEPSRAPSRAKKDEWINNTQFLRQRLTAGKASDASTVSGAGARTRRGSGDNSWLLQSLGSGGLFAEPDPLDVRVAIDQLRRDEPSNEPGSPREALLSGLDSFAPVTFDANALFAQSPQSPAATSPMSRAEYMATFSDVRRKYGESRDAGEGAGTHRFLSKVKLALTGGRHVQAARTPPGAARRGPKQRSSSDAAATRAEDSAPRVDFDLGASLMTPDSLHHQRVAEDLAVESAAAKAPEPAVANDSAYYLIDYINAQDSDAEPPARPAARRVVNKSTRARQTQYDYNYGSQIFESLDKDLLLLKTDLFRDFELGLQAALDPAPGKENARAQPQPPPGRPRKRPADVTAATAYTAAAINRIVAHNAKARSTAVPAAAAGNARSQLII